MSTTIPKPDTLAAYIATYDPPKSAALARGETVTVDFEGATWRLSPGDPGLFDARLGGYHLTQAAALANCVKHATVERVGAEPEPDPGAAFDRLVARMIG